MRLECRYSLCQQLRLLQAPAMLGNKPQIFCMVGLEFAEMWHNFVMCLLNRHHLTFCSFPHSAAHELSAKLFKPITIVHYYNYVISSVLDGTSFAHTRTPSDGTFPCTPSRHSSLPHCGRGGQSRTGLWLNSADAACAPLYVPFEARGVLLYRGPRTTSSWLSGELPPARRVIHRQTPYAMHNVRRPDMCRRGQALAHFFTLQSLATDNGRTPHYRRAPLGSCCLGGKPPLSCPPSFGLWTTPP